MGLGMKAEKRVVDQGLDEKNLAGANAHGMNAPDYSKKKLPAVMLLALQACAAAFPPEFLVRQSNA